MHMIQLVLVTTLTQCRIITRANTILMLPFMQSDETVTLSTHHVTAVNLLCEIIMVRDNFPMLPGWFTRDDIDDIIPSICVS